MPNPQSLALYLLLLLVMSLGLTGCLPFLPGSSGGDAQKKASATQEEAEAEEAGEAHEEDAADTGEATAQKKPAATLAPRPSTPELEALAAMKQLPSLHLTFDTPDGLRLGGFLYTPAIQPPAPAHHEDAKAEAAPEEPTPEEDGDVPAKPKTLPLRYPVAVLLHGLRGSARSWSDVPARLVKVGWAVLAIDLRGHGESTVRRSAPPYTWDTFEPPDWQHMPGDVGMILDQLAKDAPQYGLNMQQTALVGASLGANVALLALDASPRRNAPKWRVQKVALLSPSHNYKGLTPGLQLLRLRKQGGRLWLAYSSEQPELAADADIFASLLPSQVHGLASGGQGTDLLASHPEIKAKLVQWLTTSSSPAPAGTKNQTSPGASPPSQKPSAPR